MIGISTAIGEILTGSRFANLRRYTESVYVLTLKEEHELPDKWPQVSWLNFQNVPISEAKDINGFQVEDVLAACADRLEGFQKGSLPHPANDEAIGFILRAIAALARRTAERQERGVEGTMES
jgi:hypothetical protein